MSAATEPAPAAIEASNWVWEVCLLQFHRFTRKFLAVAIAPCGIPSRLSTGIGKKEQKGEVAESTSGMAGAERPPGLAPMETECIRPAQQGLSRTTRDEPKTLGDQCDFRGGLVLRGGGAPQTLPAGIWGL